MTSSTPDPKAPTPSPTKDTPTPQATSLVSLGRIVIYVDGVGRERAAIVSKVHNAKTGMVSLQVFEQEAYGCSLYSSVSPQQQSTSEENDAPSKPYWKWPERV